MARHAETENGAEVKSDGYQSPEFAKRQDFLTVTTRTVLKQNQKAAAAAEAAAAAAAAAASHAVHGGTHR